MSSAQSISPKYFRGHSFTTIKSVQTLLLGKAYPAPYINVPPSEWITLILQPHTIIFHGFYDLSFYVFIMLLSLIHTQQHEFYGTVILSLSSREKLLPKVPFLSKLLRQNKNLEILTSNQSKKHLDQWKSRLSGLIHDRGQINDTWPHPTLFCSFLNTPLLRLQLVPQSSIISFLFYNT